ncbi:hypothetical protein EZV62_009368 [Acer yangbiense]|uniref:25S rRNA (uridine-N(3))-methyltransferase BMT5-like domain-containing protein n=1 Tax=Acer yangbiense TaxID=1000413 RepID=A0A5C7IFT5_9ROSI|nr:hypothetical protein EZV62_009368 [Acer yangbiense]
MRSNGLNINYSSCHKILLVGEGDFSFAACLAKAFATASNIIATSLDSRESLAMKYTRATTNLKELEELGCTIFHGVDAKTMSQYPELNFKSFDRIVFNFPHAGFIWREHDILQILQMKTREEMDQDAMRVFLLVIVALSNFPGLDK